MKKCFIYQFLQQPNKAEIMTLTLLLMKIWGSEKTNNLVKFA